MSARQSSFSGETLKQMANIFFQKQVLDKEEQRSVLSKELSRIPCFYILKPHSQEAI